MMEDEYPEELEREIAMTGEIPPRLMHNKSYTKRQPKASKYTGEIKGEKYLRFFDAFNKTGERRKKIIEYLMDNDNKCLQEDILKYMCQKGYYPKRHKKKIFSDDIKKLKGALIIKSERDERDSRKNHIQLHEDLI